VVLGKEIRKVRLAAGLTQEQLGFAAGVSREYVNQLEAGKSSPTVDVFLRLCKSMHTDAAALVKAAGRSSANTTEKSEQGSHNPKTQQPVDAVTGPPLHQLIGLLLQRWRRETRKTRREVAAKIGIRREDVLASELGQRPVTLVEFLTWCEICRKSRTVTARQIAESLGYPPSWKE
jgi:transcriptional regulator with XRE-family HTH domain